MTTADRTIAAAKGSAIALGLIDPAEDDETAVFAMLVATAEAYTRLTSKGRCSAQAYGNTLQALDENLEMIADDDAAAHRAQR